LVEISTPETEFALDFAGPALGRHPSAWTGRCRGQGCRTHAGRQVPRCRSDVASIGKAISEQPRHTIANWAWPSHRQGQLEPATVEYRKSLALNPRQPEVAFNLGLAEFKQGHFNQAIPAFKTAVKLKPGDARGNLLLGMSYYGSRQYALAIPYLQQASQNDPANLELHNVLAHSCLWGHHMTAL